MAPDPALSHDPHFRDDDGMFLGGGVFRVLVMTIALCGAPACRSELPLGTEPSDSGGEPDTFDGAMTCACNSDFDGDDIVSVMELTAVLDCINGDRPCTVPEAGDVDCDGDVDFCDLSKVLCAFTHRDGSDCCLIATCAACIRPDSTCVLASEELCGDASFGIYQGDGTMCEP